METPINFVLFELLYPKLQEFYDGKGPKGYFHAILANSALGGYIGSQINGEEGAFMGSFYGMISVLPQMILGLGVREITNSISEKYKAGKEKKNSLAKFL